MGDYDSDEEQSQIEKLRYAKVPQGMFVSGWDDDADELIEEDKNPQGLTDRLPYINCQMNSQIALAEDGENGRRMILWAVNENKIHEIREILKLDADAVSAVDKDGYTPLHRACYNNFVDIAKLLLQHKADPNARTKLGWTPLHSACKWSNAECAELLLQHGSYVNAKSEGDQTPLHVAATVSNCRNTATVLLLNENVNAMALNNSEEPAEEIARRTGMTYPVFEMGHPAYQVETGLID